METRRLSLIQDINRMRLQKDKDEALVPNISHIKQTQMRHGSHSKQLFEDNQLEKRHSRIPRYIDTTETLSPAQKDPSPIKNDCLSMINSINRRSIALPKNIQERVGINFTNFDKYCKAATIDDSLMRSASTKK